MTASAAEPPAWPPFVGQLARLLRLGNPPLRNAEPDAVTTGAALLYLSSLARRRSWASAKRRAMRGALYFEPRDIARAGLFDRDYIVSELSLPPDASLRDVFVAWILDGACRTGLTWMDSAEEYRQFILDAAWKGALPDPSEAREQPRDLGDLQKFLSFVGHPSFPGLTRYLPDGGGPRAAMSMLDQLDKLRDQGLRMDKGLPGRYWQFVPGEKPQTALTLFRGVAELQRQKLPFDFAWLVELRSHAPNEQPEAVLELLEGFARLLSRGHPEHFQILLAHRIAFPNLTPSEILQDYELAAEKMKEGHEIDARLLAQYRRSVADSSETEARWLLDRVCAARALGHTIDVAHAGSLNAVFREDPFVVIDAIEQRKADVAKRFEGPVLKDLVQKAAALEPLVMHPDRSKARYTLTSLLGLERTASIQRMQEALDHRPAKAVIVVNRCAMSGAARVAAELSHALTRLFGQGEVVVLRTEHSDLDFPEWFAEGCRHLDFVGLTMSPGPDARKALLVNLLRSLAPSYIFNVNSRLLWDCTPDYAKVLNDQSNLYAYMFCSDINTRGVEAGYPVEFFADSFERLSGLISDNHSLADTLRTRFRVPPSDPRLSVLQTPFSDDRPQVQFARDTAGSRPSIFWAGRFDRQKRITLVYELAERMSDCDFRIWGKPVLDDPTVGLTPAPNMSFEGVYADFSELPLADCDLWLYTSAWDGVPTLLMDVAASGVPLVGSLVGGTGEVLAEGLSTRLAPESDADAYEAALRDVLADLPSARNRAADLARHLKDERSLDNYTTALARCIGLEGAASHA